jgi:pimeloyl-ACP methyl ester carboxylesterase
MKPVLARAALLALLVATMLPALAPQPAPAQVGKVDTAVTAPPKRNPYVRLSVNMKLTLIPPPRKAILILLPGGHGRLKMVKGKPTQLTGNFLVKERRNFVRTYFITALMDAAADLQDPPFLFGNYRRTKAHGEDVRAAIETLAARYSNKPIFVLGMSSGATGAANAAYWIGPSKIKGVVLLSAPTKPNDNGVAWVANSLPPAGANAVPVGELTVPMLFVHHQDDQCDLSPHAAVDSLVATLVAAGKDAKLVTITEGPQDANECESGLGHHSFQDKAPQVITSILSWVESKLY